MPTLKQITCHIERGPSGANLQEYNISYGDGFVETFVSVPSQAEPFSIRLTSEGYIAPGLAMFVFMDGVPQCNRNRRDLILPNSGDLSRTEIDFRVRQKEEKIDTGRWIGRQWTFASLNTAAADAAPNMSRDVVDNIGMIEVLVLRCESTNGNGKDSLPERRKGTAMATKKASLQKGLQFVSTATLNSIDDSAMDGTKEKSNQFNYIDSSLGHLKRPFALDGAQEDDYAEQWYAESPKPPEMNSWENEPSNDIPNPSVNPVLGASSHQEKPNDVSARAPKIRVDLPPEMIGDTTQEPLYNTHDNSLDGASRRGSVAGPGGGITINQYVGRDNPTYQAMLNDDARAERHKKGIYSDPGSLMEAFKSPPVQKHLPKLSTQPPVWGGGVDNGFRNDYNTQPQYLGGGDHAVHHNSTQLPPPHLQGGYKSGYQNTYQSPTHGPRDHLNPPYMRYNSRQGQAPYYSSGQVHAPHVSSPFQHQMPFTYANPYTFHRNPFPAAGPSNNFQHLGHGTYNPANGLSGPSPAPAPPASVASKKDDLGNGNSNNNDHGYNWNGGDQTTSNAAGEWNNDNDAAGNWNDNNNSGSGNNNWEDNNNNQTLSNDQAADDWNKDQNQNSWDNNNTNNENTNELTTTPAWDKAPAAPATPIPKKDKEIKSSHSSSSKTRSTNYTPSTPFKPVPKPYWDLMNAPRKSGATTPSRRRTSLMPPEPLYALPADHPDHENLTHQIQAGEAVIYHHRAGRPRYIDTFREPYAVFVFKYRSMEALERILGKDLKREEKTQKEKLASRRRMMDLGKEELVELVAKAKKKAGYNTDSPLETSSSSGGEDEQSRASQQKKKEDKHEPEKDFLHVGKATYKASDKKDERKDAAKSNGKKNDAVRSKESAPKPGNKSKPKGDEAW